MLFILAILALLGLWLSEQYDKKVNYPKRKAEYDQRMKELNLSDEYYKFIGNPKE